MNQLTVIIPFLNEGEEIEKTVASLRETGGWNFDLMLINDASTDACDYRSVARRYRARYVEHDARMGVAASRDHGVELMQTDYFLMLDGHMRVWQRDWVDSILDYIRRDHRAIYCCQTLAMSPRVMDELHSELWYHGAYIDWDDLSIKWRIGAESCFGPVESIPAVLGASYCGYRKYWTYLRGLSGLRLFGYDEQLISIKCWLEGGSCRLIKPVRFGHKFRTEGEVPYSTGHRDYSFNQAFIASLLLDEESKKNVFRNMREQFDQEIYKDIMDELRKARSFVDEQKSHYRAVFTRSIRWVEEMNRMAAKGLPFLTTVRRRAA